MPTLNAVRGTTGLYGTPGASLGAAPRGPSIRKSVCAPPCLEIRAIAQTLRRGPARECLRPQAVRGRRPCRRLPLDHAPAKFVEDLVGVLAEFGDRAGRRA